MRSYSFMSYLQVKEEEEKLHKLLFWSFYSWEKTKHLLLAQPTLRAHSCHPSFLFQNSYSTVMVVVV